MQMRPAINLLRRAHINQGYALGEFEEGIVTGQGGHGARDEEEEPQGKKEETSQKKKKTKKKKKRNKKKKKKKKKKSIKGGGGGGGEKTGWGKPNFPTII